LLLLLFSFFLLKVGTGTHLSWIYWFSGVYTITWAADIFFMWISALPDTCLLTVPYSPDSWTVGNVGGGRFTLCWKLDNPEPHWWFLCCHLWAGGYSELSPLPVLKSRSDRVPLKSVGE
jgi:hypothetical protein